MSKRKFDLTLENDRQAALQYLDELDSDENDENPEDDVSLASEESDHVENMEDIANFLDVDEPEVCDNFTCKCGISVFTVLFLQHNNLEADSSDDETLANLRAKYVENARYVSKNHTLWKRDPPTGRPTRHNTVEKNGPIDISKDISDVVSCFKYFICEAMVDKIVYFTNQKATHTFECWNQKFPNNPKVWTPVDRTEMYAVIGLLITAGALKANRESIKFLWSKNVLYSRAIFPATMSRNRFSKILAYMRFDDLTTRDVRRENDKLAAMREIFEMFVRHCKENYTPGLHLTVDEQLIAFRGKCPFRVYMKSKPAKYGLKLWAVVDCESTYAWNLQVYTGREGNTAEKQQGKRVVLDLTEDIQPGRGITTDNFFTSVPLAKALYERGLTLCGTLRKNKADIPPALLPNPNREEKSTEFAFKKYITLASYVPKKKKAVILLSTEHHDKAVSNEQNDMKPDIILHYNGTKGSVDTMDKLVNEYSVKRGTKRWPFVLFQNLIDIAGINAFALWMRKYPEWKTKEADRRRLFLLLLGSELIKPHVKKRMENLNGIPKRVVAAMKQVFPQQENTEAPSPEKAFGRCNYCPRKNDKKSRSYCAKCKNFFCKNHGIHRKTGYCNSCNASDST